MRIAVFGASGRLGRRVVQEALAREHEVTAVVRDPGRFDEAGERFEVTLGDVLDVETMTAICGSHEVVISAVSPGQDESPSMLAAAARALIAGASSLGVCRLIVAGGAGSLEVSPGLRLVDSPEFPPEWRAGSLAQAEALEVLRNEGAGADWCYVSPADLTQPGEKTGKYRTGGDQLLRDADGNSRISMEDWAVALVDEAENPQHHRERFHVAY